MSLKTRLDSDLKTAMRDRDVLRRSVIRFVLSAIHNEEIAEQAALDEERIARVLVRQAQQRRDSIEAYAQGNRQDLVEKEKAELEIIMAYLPAQMSREDILVAVNRAISETGATSPQDVGKVMSRVMPELRGKADGREVNSIASELLKGVGG